MSGCVMLLMVISSPNNQSPGTIRIGNKQSPWTTDAPITCPLGPSVPVTSSPPWTLMVPPLNSSVNINSMLLAIVSCPVPPISMRVKLICPGVLCCYS